jgi:ABC-type multidrug transport system ATPase subunit
MQITITHLGKKFGPEWIFRNLSYQINANEKIVILGGNGSGKSTLLQMLSGFVSPNEGEIIYSADHQLINSENLRTFVSFASPYLQLVEDFTLKETIEHSRIFKPFVNNLQTADVIELMGLAHTKDKFIKQFSSGMKQRLKLGLAILCDTPLLLLDEPVSNLDKEAIQWYKNLITTHSSNRTIVICSNNIEEEYFLCDKKLNVMDFKLKKQEKEA